MANETEETFASNNKNGYLQSEIIAFLMAVFCAFYFSF